MQKCVQWKPYKCRTVGVPVDVDTTARVQILDEPDYISHSTNIFGKGMKPIILPPAMGKQEGRLGSSALVRRLV